MTDIKNTVYIVKQFAEDRKAQLESAELLTSFNTMDGTGYITLVKGMVIEDEPANDTFWVDADIWKSFDEEENRGYFTIHLLCSDLAQTILSDMDFIHNTETSSLDELSDTLDEITNDIVSCLKEEYPHCEFVFVQKSEDFRKLPIFPKYLKLYTNSQNPAWVEDNVIKEIVSVTVLDLINFDCTVKDNGFVSLLEAVANDNKEVLVDDCITQEQRSCLEQFVRNRKEIA